jgi:hypothetical protein
MSHNSAESIGGIRVVIVSKILVYDDDNPEAAKRLVLRAALKLFRTIDIRAPDRAIGRRAIYTEQSILFRRNSENFERLFRALSATTRRRGSENTSHGRWRFRVASC